MSQTNASWTSVPSRMVSGAKNILSCGTSGVWARTPFGGAAHSGRTARRMRAFRCFLNFLLALPQVVSSGAAAAEEIRGRAVQFVLGSGAGGDATFVFRRTVPGGTTKSHPFKIPKQIAGALWENHLAPKPSRDKAMTLLKQALVEPHGETSAAADAHSTQQAINTSGSSGATKITLELIEKNEKRIRNLLASGPAVSLRDFYAKDSVQDRYLHRKAGYEQQILAGLISTAKHLVVQEHNIHPPPEDGAGTSAICPAEDGQSPATASAPEKNRQLALLSAEDLIVTEQVYTRIEMQLTEKDDWSFVSDPLLSGDEDERNQIQYGRAMTAKEESARQKSGNWIFSASTIRRVREWSKTEQRKIVFELQPPGPRPAGCAGGDQRRAKTNRKHDPEHAREVQSERDSRFERAVDRWVRLAKNALVVQERQEAVGGRRDDDDEDAGGVRVSAWAEKTYWAETVGGKPPVKRLVWEYSVVPGAVDQSVDQSRRVGDTTQKLDRVQKTLQKTLGRRLKTGFWKRQAEVVGGTPESSFLGDGRVVQSADQVSEDDEVDWEMYSQVSMPKCTQEERERRARRTSSPRGADSSPHRSGSPHRPTAAESLHPDWVWVPVMSSDPRVGASPASGDPARDRRISGKGREPDEASSEPLAGRSFVGTAPPPRGEEEEEDLSRPRVTIYLGSPWESVGSSEADPGLLSLVGGDLKALQHRWSEGLEQTERVLKNLDELKGQFVECLLEELVGDGELEGSEGDGQSGGLDLENLISVGVEGVIGVAMGGGLAAGLRAGMLVAPPFIAAVGKLPERAARKKAVERAREADVGGVVQTVQASSGAGEASSQTGHAFAGEEGAARLRGGAGPASTARAVFSPDSLAPEDLAHHRDLIKKSLIREIGQNKTLQNWAERQTKKLAANVEASVAAAGAATGATPQQKFWQVVLDEHPQLLDQLSKTLSAFGGGAVGEHEATG